MSAWRLCASRRLTIWGTKGEAGFVDGALSRVESYSVLVGGCRGAVPSGLHSLSVRGTRLNSGGRAQSADTESNYIESTAGELGSMVPSFLRMYGSDR